MFIVRASGSVVRGPRADQPPKADFRLFAVVCPATCPPPQHQPLSRGEDHRCDQPVTHHYLAT